MNATAGTHRKLALAAFFLSRLHPFLAETLDEVIVTATRSPRRARVVFAGSATRIAGNTLGTGRRNALVGTPSTAPRAR